eukprot:scaffold322699_cov17-Tisochrysis_lutea.AAC.1
MGSQCTCSPARWSGITGQRVLARMYQPIPARRCSAGTSCGPAPGPWRSGYAPATAPLGVPATPGRCLDPGSPCACKGCHNWSDESKVTQTEYARRRATTKPALTFLILFEPSSSVVRWLSCEMPVIAGILFAA